jgi:hypothetical protein
LRRSWLATKIRLTHHAGIERRRPSRPLRSEPGNLRLIFPKPWNALRLHFSTNELLLTVGWTE